MKGFGFEKERGNGPCGKTSYVHFKAHHQRKKQRSREEAQFFGRSRNTGLFAGVLRERTVKKKGETIKVKRFSVKIDRRAQKPDKTNAPRRRGAEKWGIWFTEGTLTCDTGKKHGHRGGTMGLDFPR